MEQHTVHTRTSLLRGIQAGSEEYWLEFYRVFSPVIRGFALKAGLTETEADEVVQETCIGVARNVGEFQYDPQKCRFRTWLLNLAAWRVKNQISKRQRWDKRMHGPSGGQTPGAAGQKSVQPDGETARTATVERVPDLSAENLDALWDREWRENILKAAIENVRAKLSPTQFQIFDLSVTKEWPAAAVAKSLGVRLATVYLTKHRVTAALKKEAARLEKAVERRENLH